MQWRVIATHPSGQKEHIIGFATEAEASNTKPLSG